MKKCKTIYYNGILTIGILMLCYLFNSIRLWPFSTTDDNWMYFLPLIKAHTDAAIHGEPLKVLWALGAGWVPWENAQVGILYFPYHISNLFARFIGHPLALLEVSAWIHLSAAGIVTNALAPKSLPPTARLVWAVAAALVPGPFLIGLNWHNYLSCYPWFLALAFMLRTCAIRPGNFPSRWEILWIGFANLGFFLSAHTQMYVLGVILLSVWALAEAPGRRALRNLVPFFWAQTLVFIPLIYLKTLSMGGTFDWMGDRGDPFYLLRHAQTLGAVIHGVVFGNLLYTKDFQLWANISWTGIGIFFSPALVMLARPLWRERQYALGGFFLANVFFMGAASIPWVRFLAIGPLEGFRWTWKIAIFIGPMALVSLLPRLKIFNNWKHDVAVPVVVAALSLFVCLRGLSFEIWPSLEAAHPIGAEKLAEETRKMARATGIAPGSRIALAGPLDMVQPLPLPMLGLVGNAPILSGLETAHVYEPMEPAWVSRGHFGLSLPWRMILPVEALCRHPAEILKELASIGVQVVVTLSPEAGRLPGACSYVDPLGRTLWVIPVPDAPKGPYPASLRRSLKRTVSGVLIAPAAEHPPRLLTPRPVSWTMEAQGWRGTPETFPVGWGIASLIGGVVGILGLFVLSKKSARD